MESVVARLCSNEPIKRARDLMRAYEVNLKFELRPGPILAN